MWGTSVPIPPTGLHRLYSSQKRLSNTDLLTGVVVFNSLCVQMKGPALAVCALLVLCAVYVNSLTCNLGLGNEYRDFNCPGGSCVKIVAAVPNGRFAVGLHNLNGLLTLRHSAMGCSCPSVPTGSTLCKKYRQCVGRSIKTADACGAYKFSLFPSLHFLLNTTSFLRILA